MNLAIYVKLLVFVDLDLLNAAIYVQDRRLVQISVRVCEEVCYQARLSSSCITHEYQFDRRKTV